MKLLLRKRRSNGKKTDLYNPSSYGYSKAFTIVELLLAITIIGLLFGGGLGGYLGLQKRTAIDQSAMNLKKDIEYIKHSALLNRKDSFDAKWISGFAIKIYKNNNNELVYRKYKFCSGSSSFESFSKAGSITTNSFIDNLTICGEAESKKFVSFENNKEIFLDKRVGIMNSKILNSNIQLIVFETITGNVRFYKLSGGGYSEVKGDLVIRLCSSDNKAARGIKLSSDSRIQFLYENSDKCIVSLDRTGYFTPINENDFSGDLGIIKDSVAKY